MKTWSTMACLWLLMLALQGVGGQDQVVFYIFSGRYLFNHNSDNLHIGKEPKKRFYLGKFSQMWMGGVADSQKRSKSLKEKQMTPKIAFFDPNFSQKPWGGWVWFTHLGKLSQKILSFFLFFLLFFGGGLP